MTTMKILRDHLGQWLAAHAHGAELSKIEGKLDQIDRVDRR